MFKFFKFRCLVLCSTAVASTMCTRPGNPVKVECASNQKKDAVTGTCVAYQSGRDKNSSYNSELNWENSKSESEDAKQPGVVAEVTGDKASEKPQVPAETTEAPNIGETVKNVIEAIKPNQANSAFYVSATATSSGAYGLNLRTTATDVKNLSVSYPANSSSFSASSGLLISADVSWEQGGKKCHLESTSFAISEYLKEKSVSSVCQ